MAQTYQVKSGDSLNQIAKQFGYSDYKQAGITGFGNNPDLITPGQQLNITGTPLTSNPVVSSGNSRNQFMKDSNDLGNMLSRYYPQNQQNNNNNNNNTPTPGGSSGSSNAPSSPGANNENATIDNYSDPYTQALDKMKANQDVATQNLINTIQAKRANRGNEITQSYERYKQGLMLLGVQSENIQSSPDIVMGNIQQAENARIAKLQELDQEEATAMLEATMAQDEKDFKLLKDRMDYIKEIKRERINTLKDSYDTMKYEQGIGEMQAEQIYSQLNTLSGDKKEQFLQEIANRFNIPVGAIVAGVAKVAEAKKKAAGSGSSTATVKQATTQAMKNFEQHLGADGKVDPYYWMEMRNRWVGLGFSTASFNSNFKHLVNPKSLALVGLEKDKTDNMDEVVQ